MTNRLVLLLALAVAQATPTGGAITKFVPPVPTPASFISDQAGVLTSDAHAALDARITGIQREGLGDIAVAILPSIGDYSPNQVAVEIYRTWRVGSMAAIGSAHRDVGALILIVPKELAPNHRGECWINTGLGAEGIITDATAGAICRDSIIPHLRDKDYARALDAGIGAVASALRSDAGLAAAPAAEHPSPSSHDAEPAEPGKMPFVLGGIGAFVAALLGFIGWRRRRPLTCSRCGRPMRKLDESADDAKLDRGQVVEEQLGSVNYDVWTCECGETSVVPHRAWFSKYSECPGCHRRAASSERTVILPATTVSSGEAEDRFSCRACGSTWKQDVVLPQLVVVTSSSGGGSSGGGDGGGGGGSSFGGSGATSGGGGGSSY